MMSETTICALATSGSGAISVIRVSGPDAIWNGTALTAIALEVTAVIVIIALTFYAQARKNDYVH